MKDGIIDLDTKRAAQFGFTRDKFNGYLWKTGNAIRVCLIVSQHRGRGDFRRLVEAIHANGFICEVVNPLAQMERIVRKNGYALRFETDGTFGEPVAIYSLAPMSIKKAA